MDLPSPERNQAVEVGVTTLDRLIEEYGVPSFCKIDVEGFEAFHASAPGKRWARFIERMEAGEDDDDDL